MKLAYFYSKLLVLYLGFLDSFTIAQLGDLIDILNPELPNGNLPLPDLSNITNLVDPNKFFSSLNPDLQHAVAKLTSILREYEDPAELAKIIPAVLSYPDLNKGVAIRAIFRTILTRDDREKFSISSIEAAPSLWFPSNVLDSLRSQLALPIGQRTCVQVDGRSGIDNGPENILWYFREDPEINSNHWNWHLVYPFDGSEEYIDRRGELFYYFHHGILARYHSERLSNFLMPITSLQLTKGGIIPEGYNSHLTESNSKWNWQDRPWNQRIPDVINASFANLTMDEYLMYRQRIIEAIDSGSIILPDNSLYSIRNTNGTNVLGDLIEASIWSRNPDYYWGFGIHNDGHIFIGNSVNPNDPEGSFPTGVMSDTATAMRDLAFYRWHLNIEELYVRNKNTLTPYQRTGGEFPLSWPGIYINNLYVISKNRLLPNQLFTFWSSTKYTLRNGLDFQRNETQGPVEVCVTHLNHENFEYRFRILNTFWTTKTAAVRIFMAPRRNAYGQRYSMNEQRSLFFALDTFSVKLSSGYNDITRQSTASTLTISSQQAIDELNNDQNRTTPVCGCGFPHYLMIPKGRPTGMDFDLFAMVTEEDALTSIPPHQPSTSSTCKEAYLYCGSLRNTKKYPDIKPMGYPFDRRPYNSASTGTMVRNLDEYVAGITNMWTMPVGIFHNPTISSIPSLPLPLIG